MPDSDVNPAPQREYIAAKNRREAMSKLVAAHPSLRGLYKEGPSGDGKAGWVNAIRDQHSPAYRLLFYLDRLPIAEDQRGLDLHELFFGEYDADADPNFQRVLFTTTGGVNLLRQDLPDESFATALITRSLEVVPLSMERDLRITHLLDDGYAYICAFDEVRQGLWILNLKEFHEIYVSKEKKEIQVRDEERIIVGDTRIVRPFLLRYVIKRASDPSQSPSEAAGRMLDE